MSNPDIPKADIFICYVEEDSDVVKQLADGLEDAGYTTWYYERDTILGQSYSVQVAERIAGVRVILVVISKAFLSPKSPHTTNEILRAHEQGKRFVPVLRGVTHAELQEARPDLALCFGGAVSITIPSEGIFAILTRITRDFAASGFMPAGSGKAPRPQTPEGPSGSPAPPREPGPTRRKTQVTPQTEEELAEKWRRSRPRRPRRRLIVTTAQLAGILAIAVVLVLIANRPWRFLHKTESVIPGRTGQDRPRTAAAVGATAYQILGTYKVDVYFDKDSSYDERMANRIRAFLAESTVVRQVVLVPSSATDFLSRVGEPLGYEVRYDSGEEYSSALALVAVLNGLDLDKPYSVLKFEPRRIGTRTPGTLSIFIFSQALSIRTRQSR